MDEISFDLSEMDGSQKAIVIDCKNEYAEIDKGEISPGQKTISFTKQSDWAVAIGDFKDSRTATANAYEMQPLSEAKVLSKVTSDGIIFLKNGSEMFNKQRESDCSLIDFERVIQIPSKKFIFS